MNRLILSIILCFSIVSVIAQPVAVSNSRVLLVENQTILLKTGETCTITLDEKNKGQYAWSFSFSQNNSLYKKSETFSEGKRTFVFATAGVGEVTVTMTLMNRQTGAVSKVAPKIYKVSVSGAKTTTTMAAVVNPKPQPVVSQSVVNRSKPMPSAAAAALTQPENAPVYASLDSRPELYAKSDAPTNAGFYPTVTTTNATRGVSRGAAKTKETASAAPASGQPMTSMAVSSFHTDTRSLSVFDKNVVAENEVFGIDIEENIPTGKWTYVVDKSSIQLVDEEVFDKSYGLASKHKLHSYKFKATQAGVYDILFHVFSTENHTIDKYITYTIEVK